MLLHFYKFKFLLLALLTLSSHSASALENVGILGNSGIAGDSLIITDTSNESSGIYIDDDLVIWSVAGENSIQASNMMGHSLGRYSMEPACTRIDTTSLAGSSNGVLYFTGLGPGGQNRHSMKLFAFDTKTQNCTEIPFEGRTDPTQRELLVLAPQIENEQLLIGLYSNEKDAVYPDCGIYRLNLQSMESEKIISWDTPGTQLHGLALDPANHTIYVGGYWGKYVVSNHWHPATHEIIEYDSTGKEIRRTDTLDMAATPSQFRGDLSLAANSIWSFAWYGFLGIRDLQLNPTPGKVTGWEMQIRLISQIIDIPRPRLNDESTVNSSTYPLLIASHETYSHYLASWQAQKQQFDLTRRIGSLPDVQSINLNSNGWVSVGLGINQLWWRWDDPANAAPMFGNHGVAVGAGFFDDEGNTLLAPAARTDPKTKHRLFAQFRPETARNSCQYEHRNPPPFALAAGIAAYATDKNSRTFVIIDKETGTLWSNRAGLNNNMINRSPWSSLTLEGGTLNSPDDIVYLGNDKFVVADSGYLVFLQRDADNVFHITSRMNKWGNSPEQTFGDNIRIAGESLNLLISDSDRHRVLHWDLENQRIISQLGQTDQAGTSLHALSHPTVISVSGDRALIYDSDNQRIIKAKLK